MPARSNMCLGAARAWAPAGAGQLERPVSRRIWYLLYEHDHARFAGRKQEGEHAWHNASWRRAVPCPRIRKVGRRLARALDRPPYLLLAKRAGFVDQSVCWVLAGRNRRRAHFEESTPLPLSGAAETRRPPRDGRPECAAEGVHWVFACASLFHERRTAWVMRRLALRTRCGRPA